LQRHNDSQLQLGGRVANDPVKINIDGVCPLLQVFDMPTSVKFYREVLGFELAGNSPMVKSPEGEYFHWAMLRRGSTTIMLNTAYDGGQRPPARDPARVAAHGHTALFFGCPDVDTTYNQLLSFGGKVLEKPMTTGYGMRRFAIADPDGYNLFFQGQLPTQ
jgi:glyoxylase I family protein